MIKTLQDSEGNEISVDTEGKLLLKGQYEPDIVDIYNEEKQNWQKAKDRLNHMEFYLKMRQEMKDWHGVMDASCDIRELKVEVEVLNRVLQKIGRFL